MAQATESVMRDVYTVSRLNFEARQCLESSFPPIWVEGEISNLARPRSGHLYFSLKDDRCQVRCAMFRAQNRLLDFEPVDGLQVLAQSRVSLYPERGDFQLIVQYLEESGAGALRRAFEALKQRLAAEGLFDSDRKRAPPEVPHRVGIVTSPTGAALRDVLSILRRRFPGIDVLIYPVPVQGDAAAPEIARMLDVAGRRAECDVLILTRGGGSLEDLWPFNDEVVARAIYRCPIPVVTGIGHEVDFTIADFVADRRAPTPSAAAELVTPDATAYRGRIAAADVRLFRHMSRLLGEHRARVAWILRRLPEPRRRIFDLAQGLDHQLARLGRAARAALHSRQAELRALGGRLYRHDPSTRLTAHRVRWQELDRRVRASGAAAIADRRALLHAVARALETVSPLQTLERGYAIVTRRLDGAVLRSADDVAIGQQVGARLARGELVCTVDDRQEP